MDLREIRESAIEARARGPGEGKKWTLAETILAFLCLVYLNPARLGGSKRRKDGSSTQESSISLLASILGRTENSVVMKVMNLRWFYTGGEKGMRRGSVLDNRVAGEFQGNLERLVAAQLVIEELWPATADLAVDLGRSRRDVDAGSEIPADAPAIRETRGEATVAVRLGQGMFRSRVLDNYQRRCACCGLRAADRRNDRVFIVAGHIRPWKVASDHQRLDPRNGIAFCSIHDRAFEYGLMTLDRKLRIEVARASRSAFGPPEIVREYVLRYEGAAIDGSGSDFEPPGVEYLDYHREVIFGRFGRPA